MNTFKTKSLLLPILLFAILFEFTACNDHSANQLPVLGTLSRDFTFTNQDSQKVSPTLFENKIVITDFFFTTCPSICPIMKRQMYRVYDQFKDNPEVLLFSHTIDPEHDTAEVLHNYAKGLGIKTSSWQMVTGSQDEIFAMAKHYMLGAMKNEEVPGGYIHSGSFVLMDRQHRIRGYYKGTDAEEVDTLIADIKSLLND